MGADANSRSSLAHASSPVTEAQRSSTVEPATNCPEGLCLSKSFTHACYPTGSF